MMAGLSGNDIDYVEAHGTGTSLGIQLKFARSLVCSRRDVTLPSRS